MDSDLKDNSDTGPSPEPRPKAPSQQTESVNAAGQLGCLNHPEGQLSYQVHGTGTQYMILFHGYGQDASYWLPLVEAFEADYTFVLVDLYFHGQSNWEDKQRVLYPHDWKGIVMALLDQLKIQKAIVGGFSIGCKFALATIVAMPERVSNLILVAPDGLVGRFWYRMATSSSVGRQWFKRLVTKPGAFFKLANLLHGCGLMDRTLLSFVGNQMNTRQKRLKVFCTWTVFRGLRFAPRQISQTLNHHRIPLLVFLGKWDKVISRKHVAPLLGLVKDSKVMVLEASHHNLVAKVASHFKQSTLQLSFQPTQSA